MDKAAAATAAAAALQQRLERARRFRFDKFTPEIEEFDYYIQRFELELQRHGITGAEYDNAKRSLLLTSIGPEPFRVLVDRFRPTPVVDQTYNALKTTLEGYFRRQVCTMAKRVRFTQ